jgi:exo-beta-1,3-glucanase (GH17 family)
MKEYIIKYQNNLMVLLFSGSLIAASLFLIGFKQSNKINQPNLSVTFQKEDKMKQSSGDLLAGISQAICYSGFRSGQHPDRGDGAKNPSYEEILEDLQILAKDGNFKLIRLYDSKENSEMTLRVIKENNIDIKVLLGIWLDAELSAHETCGWLTEPIPEEKLAANRETNSKEIEQGIRLAKQYPEIVAAVNVGNESLVDWNDHLVEVDSVISYVQRVKQAIEQPVTVAENYKWWADYGAELVKEVDFLSIHVYPVWLGYDIDSGMIKTLDEIAEVRQAFPDKQIVITEAGWATISSEFGPRASEEKQMQYYNDLMEFAKQKNITTFFFEAFDEDWKGNPDNPLGAEKHWGIFTVDRKPKKVMQDLYPELLEEHVH